MIETSIENIEVTKNTFWQTSNILFLYCLANNLANSGISKLLKDTRPTPITTLTQLKKAISGRKNDGKTLLASDKDIEKIFETLELELDKVKTTVSPNGCKIVKDLETGEKIWISPASKNNIHYVLIEPKSLEQNVERYAISKDGQILAEYKSINGIKQFKENFNSTLIKKEK